MRKQRFLGTLSLRLTSSTTAGEKAACTRQKETRMAGYIWSTARCALLWVCGFGGVKGVWVWGCGGVKPVCVYLFHPISLGASKGISIIPNPSQTTN